MISKHFNDIKKIHIINTILIMLRMMRIIFNMVTKTTIFIFLFNFIIFFTAIIYIPPYPSTIAPGLGVILSKCS